MTEQRQPHSEQEEAYRRIVGRVEKRFEVRTQFAAHLAAFIAMVLVWQTILPDIQFWNVVFGFWFAGLMIHGINTLFFELRERAIDQQLEHAGLIDPGKLKRGGVDENVDQGARLVRLSEDGELEPLDDPFIENHDQQARR